MLGFVCDYAAANIDLDFGHTRQGCQRFADQILQFGHDRFCRVAKHDVQADLAAIYLDIFG